jgi:hypothetical protein
MKRQKDKANFLEKLKKKGMNNDDIAKANVAP